GHFGEHLPAVRKVRVVDLADEAGVDDGPVFFLHRVGDGVEHFLVRLVVLVVDPVLHGAWGDGGQVCLDVQALDGGLEVGYVFLVVVLADVGDGADAKHQAAGAVSTADAGAGVVG